MSTVKLFYATNRKHTGKDRWAPSGYGKEFSSDGMQNLRFGAVDVPVSDKKVGDYLKKKANGRRGDGEGLSGYLSKAAKRGKIKAYRDWSVGRGGAVATDKRASTKVFLDIKKRMMHAADVVLFIHGYNVNWEQAVGSALALQYMLNRNRAEGAKEVMVVLFSWPSDGSVLPFAAYGSDRGDAQASGLSVGRAMLLLRDFLLSLWKRARREEEKLCNRDLHLLCHSMGNYVLQNALAKLADHAEGPKLPRLFKHVFLCAADVDDEVLESGKEMGRLHEVCTNVTVYYNAGDVGLFISDHTKGNPDRLGQSGNAHPSLVHNKVHQVDCGKIVGGAVEHSYFLWGTVNDDIRQCVDDVAFDDDGRKRKRLGHSNTWMIR